jgi:hypothetical protein
MLGTTHDKFTLTHDIDYIVFVVSRNYAFDPHARRGPGECLKLHQRRSAGD